MSRAKQLFPCIFGCRSAQFVTPTFKVWILKLVEIVYLHSEMLSHRYDFQDGVLTDWCSKLVFGEARMGKLWINEKIPLTQDGGGNIFNRLVEG